MLKVMIAEDLAVIRSGLVKVLEGAFGITVVAQVGRGDEAVRAALAATPDVAVLDINMPGGDGLAVAGDLRVQVPSCRTLLLTALDRPGLVRRAQEVGAAGFLLKSATAEEFLEAVRVVASGGRIIDPALAAAARESGVCPLAKRELEVLRCARTGASAAEIGADLFLGVGTVRNLLSAAKAKLRARTLLDAVRIAERNGWI
ncbi:response regulator transcription factor [Streptomyces sp. NBC_00237]|uniref:response regulator transcription factor n=1 Tax=Streptomyces sp. NBC_00237 TaxID=2975687 RepID=UPI0022513246|nr:response regulator transcription factor [Streptomyces sp. NBC_00237]MCX5201566.1 response regulator transcription factor [Streptomyces sp. NBC_00237]